MSNADRYKKVYPVTWDQLHRDAKALAWRLLEKGPFTSIIGVARGGLVPRSHRGQRTGYPHGRHSVQLYLSKARAD